MHKTLTTVLRGYRYLISTMLGPCCRFYPSCSTYAIEAIEQHGTTSGLWLALRRLVRCNPWNEGGVDPVPQSAGRATQHHEC